MIFSQKSINLGTLMITLCLSLLLSISGASITTNIKEKYLINSFYDSTLTPKTILLDINDQKFFIAASEGEDVLYMLDLDTGVAVNKSKSLSGQIQQLFYLKSNNTVAVLLSNGVIPILGLEDRSLPVLKELKALSDRKSSQISNISQATSDSDKIYLYLNQKELCRHSLLEDKLNCITLENPMSSIEATVKGVIAILSGSDEIHLYNEDLTFKKSISVPKNFEKKLGKINFETFSIRNISDGGYYLFTINDLEIYETMKLTRINELSSTEGKFKPISNGNEKAGVYQISADELLISTCNSDLVDNNDNLICGGKIANSNYFQEISCLDVIRRDECSFVTSHKNGQVSKWEIKTFSLQATEDISKIFYNNYNGDIFLQSTNTFYKIDGITGQRRDYSFNGVISAGFQNRENKTLAVFKQDDLKNKTFSYEKYHNMLIIKTRFDVTKCNFIEGENALICLFTKTDENFELKKIDINYGNQIVVGSFDNFNGALGIQMVNSNRDIPSLILYNFKDDNAGIDFYELGLKDSSIKTSTLTADTSNYGKLLLAHRFNNFVIMCFKKNFVLQFDIANHSTVKTLNFPQTTEIHLCQFSEDLETLIAVNTNGCFFVWSLSKELEIEIEGYGIIRKDEYSSANKLAFLGNKKMFLFSESYYAFYKANIDNFRFKITALKALSREYFKHLAFDNNTNLLLSSLEAGIYAVLNLTENENIVSKFNVSKNETCNLATFSKVFLNVISYCCNLTAAWLKTHDFIKNTTLDKKIDSIGQTFIFSKRISQAEELILLANNTHLSVYKFNESGITFKSIEKFTVYTFPLPPYFYQIHTNNEFFTINNSDHMFWLDGIVLITNEYFSFKKASNFSYIDNLLSLEEIEANNLYVQSQPFYLYLILNKNGNAKIFTNDYQSINANFLGIDIKFENSDLISDIKNGSIITIGKDKRGVTYLIGNRFYEFNWKFISVKSSVELLEEIPQKRQVMMAVTILDRNLIISADQQGLILVQHSQTGEILYVSNIFKEQQIQSIAYCFGNRILLSTNKGFFEYDFIRERINYAYNKSLILDARCVSQNDYSRVFALAGNKSLMKCDRFGDDFNCTTLLGTKVPDFAGKASIIGERSGGFWIAQLSASPSFTLVGNRSSDAVNVHWASKEGEINWVSDDKTLNYISGISKINLDISQPTKYHNLILSKDSCDANSWCDVSKFETNTPSYNVQNFLFNENGVFKTLFLNGSACEFGYEERNGQCSKLPEIDATDSPSIKPAGGGDSNSNMGMPIGIALGIFIILSVIVSIKIWTMKKKLRLLRNDIQRMYANLNNMDIEPEEAYQQLIYVKKYKENVTKNGFIFKKLELIDDETNIIENDIDKICVHKKKIKESDKKGSFAHVVPIEFPVSEFMKVKGNNINNSSIQFSKVIDSFQLSAKPKKHIRIALKIYKKEDELYSKDFENEYNNYKKVLSGISQYNKQVEPSKILNPSYFLEFFGLAMSHKVKNNRDNSFFESALLLEYVDSSLRHELDNLPKEDLNYRLSISIEISIKAGLFSKIELVHCDLKRDNILIKRNGMKSEKVDQNLESTFQGMSIKSPFTVKICDYGSMRVINDLITSNVGFSDKYTPPEIKSIQNDTKIPAATSIDVFAVGIILREDIFCDFLKETNDKAILRNRLNTIIDKATSQNPKQRPTFDQLTESLLSLKKIL